jgi:hypothetical protein
LLAVSSERVDRICSGWIQDPPTSGERAKQNKIPDHNPVIEMENVMFRQNQPGWVIPSILILYLSACGSRTNPPTAVNVDAIYTQAAVTVAARFTQTALAFTKTPAASLTPQVSKTPVASQTPLITNTPDVTSTPILIATQVQTVQGSCDNMLYVSDVTIVDGSLVAPGSKFVKTWRIRNNGQCTWSTNYRLIYGWSSDSWKDIRQAPPASVLLTKAVNPGEEYEISVTLVAPITSGNYQAAFRLQNDKGFNFGTILTLLYQVTGTPTP